MADNRVTEAVDVVARWALSLSWEDFPEIGEHDWDAIAARAAAIVDCPSVDEYEAAYEFLAARADGGEATS